MVRVTAARVPRSRRDCSTSRASRVWAISSATRFFIERASTRVRRRGRCQTSRKIELFRAFRATMNSLKRRGGSHMGDHMDGRFPGGLCPKDGGTMLIATIGGRTTYWCSVHQR